jgi:diguanylate cyclase (GGDEF)-like protein
MSSTPSPISGVGPDWGAADIQASLRKLERRSLWVWGNAVIIILGLTAAVASLSVSFYLNGAKTLFGLDFRLAVRALVALVLVFTAHMIYQHLRLRNVQRELAEQQIQAEVFRRLAMFDPLTGLYNRRFAEQRLRAEIARAERRGLTMIVLLLDLNDFKQINDRYGHPAGDGVLKEFSKWLSRCTRGSDLAARWGGDEFMVLLLDCEVHDLSLVLTRIDGFKVELKGKEVPVSFAVGWKAYEPGDQVSSLLEAADQNLYRHKATLKQSQRAVPTLV